MRRLGWIVLCGGLVLLLALGGCASLDGQGDDDLAIIALCVATRDLEPALVIALTVWNDRLTSDPTTDTPPAGQLDLASVLTHEVGHVLGLGHNVSGPTVMSPVIAAPGTTRRALTPADLVLLDAEDDVPALLLVADPPCDVEVLWRDVAPRLAEASRHSIAITPSLPWYVVAD